MFNRIAFFSLFSLITACTGGPGVVHMEKGSDGFAVQSSAFIPSKDANGRIVSGALILSNQPDLCRSLMSGRMPTKLKGIVFSLVRVSNSQYLAPDADKYTVVVDAPNAAGSYASGSILKQDLNCQDTLSYADGTLVSGSVTIDQFEPGDEGVVSGSFKSSNYSHGDVTGRFTAEYCDANVSNIACKGGE